MAALFLLVGVLDIIFNLLSRKLDTELEVNENPDTRPRIYCVPLYFQLSIFN